MHIRYSPLAIWYWQTNFSFFFLFYWPEERNRWQNERSIKTCLYIVVKQEANKIFFVWSKIFENKPFRISHNICFHGFSCLNIDLAILSTSGCWLLQRNFVLLGDNSSVNMLLKNVAHDGCKIRQNWFLSFFFFS